MSTLLLALALLSQGVPAGEAANSRDLVVTVIDEKGAAVTGLSSDDVAVMEDGVARAVTRLEPDARPLTVALIVDTSEPVSSLYRLQVLDAVLGFLRRLPEGTRYAVWTTGDRPKKVVDYTSDPTLAREPLRRIFPQGGNTIFDAIVEASRDLKTQEGQRAAVVLVTALGVGFTNYQRQQVVEEGLKSRAVFLAASFDEGRTSFQGSRTEDGEVGTSDYEYVLTALTQRSGGHREALLSAMGLEAALQRLTAELRGQYRLSYLALPGTKTRKLEVTVARPGVKARVSPSGR